MFLTFTKTFREVLNNHVPLKSRENVLAMKRAKKYCDKLTKSTQEIFFFLRIIFTVKRFFINKGFLKNDNIAINVEDESATD